MSTTASLLRQIRRAGPFRVVSLVSGRLTIEPAWPGCGPAACQTENRPEGLNYCQACDCPHIAGFMGRMGLAAAIEDVLNGPAKPGRARNPNGGVR